MELPEYTEFPPHYNLAAPLSVALIHQRSSKIHPYYSSAAPRAGCTTGKLGAGHGHKNISAVNAVNFQFWSGLRAEGIIDGASGAGSVYDYSELPYAARS